LILSLNKHLKLKNTHIILIIFSLVNLSGCGFTNCGEDSEAVAYARSFSETRLEKLYSQMQYYYHYDNTPIFGWNGNGDDKNDFPKEFRDLKVVKIRPKDSNMMVQGCFDEYVYLHFRNLDSEIGPKLIELDYPSHSGEAYDVNIEVLWAEKNDS